MVNNYKSHNLHLLEVTLLSGSLCSVCCLLFPQATEINFAYKHCVDLSLWNSINEPAILYLWKFFHSLNTNITITVFLCKFNPVRVPTFLLYPRTCLTASAEHVIHNGIKNNKNRIQVSNEDPLQSQGWTKLFRKMISSHNPVLEQGFDSCQSQIDRQCQGQCSWSSSSYENTSLEDCHVSPTTFHTR